MVLGFNKQFVKPILNGTKIHTIRRDENNRWKAGNSIQHATGVRSANYNQFKESTCFSTQRINIDYYYDAKKGNMKQVSINGLTLSTQQIKLLAFNDGFNSVDEFFEWFNTDFDGKIIHWTNFKY